MLPILLFESRRPLGSVDRLVFSEGCRKGLRRTVSRVWFCMPLFLHARRGMTAGDGLHATHVAVAPPSLWHVFLRRAQATAFRTLELHHERRKAPSLGLKASLGAMSQLAAAALELEVQVKAVDSINSPSFRDHERVQAGPPKEVIETSQEAILSDLRRLSSTRYDYKLAPRWYSSSAWSAVVAYSEATTYSPP